jgi:hypothetical protein
VLDPRIAIAGLALGALTLAPTALAAQEQPAPAAAPPTPAIAYSDSRVIVEWATGTDHADKVGARSDAEVEFKSDLGNRSFQLVEIEAGQTAREAIGELRSDPAVTVAERDGYSTPNSVPNDPLFGELWGLRNTGAGIAGFSGALASADINAPLAWDRTVGSPSTVIADIDTGYRFGDSELGAVAWTNSGEAPDDGIDNDGNGLIDDVHGYDFVGPNADSPSSDADPSDDNLISGGHGIHTAGTMGAAGNNATGISGVARNVRIMPLRVCANSASAGNEARCPFSSQVAAINYAGAKGARAANMSLGGTTFSEVERNAIAANPATLYVISAGNDAQDNDSVPHYPCNYDPLAEGKSPVDNVICVAATDQADELAGFSDWGATSVDLGAPGTEILSTYLAKDNWASDDFETNDFDAKWLPYESGFGRAAAGDGALTSFGMTDTPGEAPEANHVYAVLSGTNVQVPAGTGLCRIKGMRYRKGGSYNYGYFLDEGHSGIKEFIGGETAGSAMVAFQTEPILNLAGHIVTLYFEYTADSTPTTGEGVWLDDVRLECFAPLGTPLAYEFLQGTSMAAPQVTGAAALLWSLKPSASVTEVREALLNSADPIASLSGKTATGGRLDVAAALDALAPPGTETVAPETTITGQPASSTQSTAAKFEFRRTDADAGTYECSVDGAAFAPCSSPDSFSVTVGAHTFQVRAKNAADLVDPTPASASWTVSAPAAHEDGGGTVVVSPPAVPTSPSSPAPPSPPTPSSGPNCVVPKLAGKKLGQARSALSASHCTVGKVTKPKVNHGRSLGGLVVVSSAPSQGAKPADGKVNLTLGHRHKPKHRRH